MKINEVFSDWLTNGIFTYLDTLDIPWKSLGVATDLDIAYHGTKSGDKTISPLIEKFLNSDNTLTDENKEKIANMLVAVCGKNWGKLWETLNFEYNPLENYNMTETETATGTGTETQTGTNTIKQTGTNTVESTGTDTVKKDSDTTNKTTEEDKIYGFNSASGKEADSKEVTEKGTLDDTTKETRALKDETTRNLTDTETKNLSNANTTSNNRELTRAGNIGVTTSQRLIQSERDLWNWFFYDIVFTDIDKYLTIGIYE